MSDPTTPPTQQAPLSQSISESPTVKELFCSMKPPTPLVAKEFFDQLDRVSSVARYRLAGTYDYSPYGRSAYSASPLPCLPRSNDGMPGGVVIHYTASPTLASAVAWFCKPELASGRSAHVVVAQGPDPVISAKELAMYPLVAQLPTLPVICRPLAKAGVHATWANGAMLGIEGVNLGFDTAKAKGRQCQQAAGKTWEIYPRPQVATIAYIVRCLQCIAPYVGRDMVLGHEHVQGAKTPMVYEDKRDPGPLFPFEETRALLTESPHTVRYDPTSDTGWMKNFAALGYGGPAPSVAQMYVFQYMMGLVVDGKVGPKTQEAIRQRLADRGLAAP